MPRATRSRLYALLAALILIGAGAFFFTPRADSAGNAAPAGAPPAMPVEALLLKEESAQVWQSFSGRLQAVDYVEIRPQVSGSIQEIKFEDGQEVNKGDVLFVVEPAPYKAAVAQAAADLQAAKDQATLAKKDLGRAQELIGSGAIPKRVLDERESGAQVAKSNIAAAAARLEKAKIDLDHAYIKAPISGRASRAEITLGNLVEAGASAPVLTSIVSREGIYADFDVDEETYLQHVRPAGDGAAGENQLPVRVMPKNNNDMVYEGRIHSFDNRIDTASGTIRARAFFANEDGALLPGMFVTIELGSADQGQNIIVPERAIGTDQDRKFVYVVGKDNMLAYREVTLGPQIQDRRIISSGLKAGEVIVTDGLLRLHPGMPVVPKIQKDMGAPPVSQPETLLPEKK